VRLHDFDICRFSVASVSLPDGAPGRPASLPPQWQTINPAHAIQSASAIVTFSEEITSFVVKRLSDALRTDAQALGLIKEEPINMMLFQLQPGGVAQTKPSTQAGTTFQRVQGSNVVQSLSVTTQALRLDTFAYTRWIAFREQMDKFLTKAMPLVAQASQVNSIALEYVDFFYATDAGSADAQLIIDRGSDLIARKAFNRRSPFHSHSGWFESETAVGRRLVNIDVTVNDAAGPVGIRRAITIRTHESEQVIDLASVKAAEFLDASVILAAMDVLHVSLKKRRRSVLTRDAAAMISLGN